MNMPQKETVIVGISGGVDSSVAALRLKEQGFQVEGLFMKNWEEDDTKEHCSAEIDLKDAQSVCDEIGIKLHTINFSAEYWDHVFTHFLDEYRAGRTPNPDILCNKEIKFKAFLDHAIHLGANKIATGHYARVEERDHQFYLLKGKDSNKDQSYFLYTLGQHQLSHTLFPVGELEKPEVRAIAQGHNFVTSGKKDSTGICFIGERNFREFLSRYIPANPGDMVTLDGEIVARHNGLMYYTLGQRQGLGIGGRADSSNEPWYVIDKDMDNNQLIVAQGHNHPHLFKKQCYASNLSWVSGEQPELPYRCKAKTRYRQQEQPCTIEQSDSDELKVLFNEPQWAITPGQSIVFYQDEICLGGGIIERAE